MSKVILPYKGKTPKISSSAFIAPNTSIIGDVTIAERASIWFGVTIRGDVAKICIGSKTNIQDNAVIHVTRDGHDTIIGNNVTIGHGAIIHGCHIHDKAFIGMGAIILDDAVIATNAMVAAGSLLTKGKIVGSGELWVGNPAKFFRMLTCDEIEHIQTSSENYYKHCLEYLDLCRNN